MGHGDVKLQSLECSNKRISGLVVEYIVAIDVTRVRFPADALFLPIKLLRYRDRQ